jgi:hypothetical protein
MKNLLILATMLLTFSFVNAQSKIYNVRYANGSKNDVVGYFESDKIYNVRYANGSKNDVIGYVEGGKIYNVRYANGSKNDVIGYVEGDKIYNVRYANGSKNDVVGYYELPEDYLRLGTVSPPDVIEGTKAAAAFLLLY